MTQLASSIQNIRDYYTVVVIGSGYGGGIAASRLARAGQTVCVLERGKEFQPGDYPDTSLEFMSESQVHLPGGATHGPQTGLYDFRLNQDLNALVGCGLGGTSLINAGVALRPEPRVFDDPRWPAAFRAEVATRLEDGFRRAEEMLQTTPYPEDAPRLPKMDALQKSAAVFGEDTFARLPINVTFEDGINHVGVKQAACKLCGDCMSGCNHGAKNTVLMNYLPDAKNHGAEIFTRVAVHSLVRKADRWLVYYQVLDEGRESFGAPEAFVSAEIVILAAGTFGSTEILLRSKAAGLPLSDELGKHFSGNGDMIGFSYNSDVNINMVGFGHHPAKDKEPVGPVITSMIDLRNQPDLEDGLVIQEGGATGALANFLPLTMATASRLAGCPIDIGLEELIRKNTRELESLVSGAYRGALRNTQIYLVMTHDSSSGTLHLDESDELRISWPGAGAERHVRRVNSKLWEATEQLRGTFIENPMWSRMTSHTLMTAHPLGGCVMAEDAEHGVVNHKGQVFADTLGSSVYEGLYVNDGAVIPRSLGVNPHITISAVAERNCALLIADRGWEIDYGFASVPEIAPTHTAPERHGIKFTEAMEGFFSLNVTDNFDNGAKEGRAAGSSFRFIVSIESDDVETLMESSEHRAQLFGTVTAPALSSSPLTVTEGEFNLFMIDPDLPETRLMRYRMKLTTAEGKVYGIDGRKFIHDNRATNLWHDVTTLYITVHAGACTEGPVIGKGILKIMPKDLQHQLRTMQVTHALSISERLRTLTRFGKFFAGDLFDVYGGVFARQTYFHPDAPPRKKRPLRLDSPEVHYFTTDDDETLRLTRYRGGGKGPVMLVHGLGVSSLAFSTDLIDTNLTEYLYAHGYDVWLLDFRSSIELPYAKTQYTADDVAKYDWPAAVGKVRDITGAADIQVVAHCYGAITFSMAMLSGLQGVRSAVCSQVGAHLSIIPVSRIKSGLHLDSLLAGLGVESLSLYTDSHDDWLNRMFNRALELYPVAKHEHCDNPVCHRVTFLYAPIYKHEQLNAITHDNIHELFGVASISNFEHLGVMTRARKIVNAKGDDVYLPHVERLAIPIAFIHGAENELWLPDSTRQTYEWLCEANGAALYSRHLVPHFGHIDCIFGKNAALDVYPIILKHLEATL
ncbi:MAG: alpha/beta fold hydrolase [Chloroflexota bacterium]